MTQHPATQEQVAVGVFEPVDKGAIQALLTFDEPPSEDELRARAKKLAYRVLEEAEDPDAVMIGGAGFLMGPLEEALRGIGQVPIHAFSKRVVVEAAQADGTVTKTACFKHVGFVGL